MDGESILRVAVPAPLYGCFDYLPPAGTEMGALVPGIRVRVPFGHGERVGILLGVQAESSVVTADLRRVLALLDPVPLLPAESVALLEWAADYYRHPLGEVMAGALPVRLRKGEAAVTLDEPGWRLTPAGRELNPAALFRAPKQTLLLNLMNGQHEGMTQAALRSSISLSVLHTVEKKGWIEPCRLESSMPVPVKPISNDELVALNRGQSEAVEAVAGCTGFSAFLVDGVTGSGKTEVYLRLVEAFLARGRQVLILVPEIGLTPQLVRRFAARLGTAATAVLHSAISGGGRERAWHQARLGVARVLIGTRSALFTPMPELGLIVVDEEHDLSFKQQEGFRYSARDLAIVRAKRSGCPIVLGSATPSLESLHNANCGRYSHLCLPERAGDAVTPVLDLVDIRSVRLEAGLSPTLLRLVGETLEAGNQALLFLNRRGYAPMMTCHDCGWVAQCRHCDARMTLHLESRTLWCHHCGYRQRLAASCPECGKSDLRHYGQGTERLQEMLESRFPGIGIARIDRDSTRRRGSMNRLLEEIRQGRYSILLGTQMLAKGHHFPDVTLVGVIDVDQGLFGADYRAPERMAQQVIQVAGRAGRADKPGRVIIQTRHPDHPMMQLLVRRGYHAFAAEALAERQAASLPPFSHQALLRAEAPDADAPRRFLEEALAAARRLGGESCELWGPVPAPMERRAGRYRAHLLVQSGQRGSLQNLLAPWVPGLQRLPSARRVRWSIDVDPQEMM